MKVEDHVRIGFDQGLQGNLDAAMTHACIAVDATSRKHFGVNKSTRDHFKAFVRQSHWIIEPFIGMGLNLEESRFRAVTVVNDGGKLLSDPDFADIAYHIFRCSHVHGHEVQDGFEFTKSEDGKSLWRVREDGAIQVPDRVLWALMAAVVFSRSNADIQTTSPHHFTWGAPSLGIGTYFFNVDLFWGQEDMVRKFFAARNLMRVAIKFEKPAGAA